MSDTAFNIMSTYSTEDLLAIITKNSNDYSLQELDAAKNELKLRNVDTNNLSTKLERLDNNDIRKTEEDKVEVKMNIYMKILTFFLPFIITGVLNAIRSLLGIDNSLSAAITTLAILIISLVSIYYYIKKSGYIKMAKQFRIWIIVSFVFCVALFLLEDILIAMR